MRLLQSHPPLKIVYLSTLSWVNSSWVTGCSRIPLLQKQKSPPTIIRKVFLQVTVAVVLQSMLRQSIAVGNLVMLSTVLRLKKFLTSWVLEMVVHQSQSILTSTAIELSNYPSQVLYATQDTQVTSLRVIRYISFKEPQSHSLDGLDMLPTGIIAQMKVSMICISVAFLVTQVFPQTLSDKVVTTSVSLKTSTTSQSSTVLSEPTQKQHMSLTVAS